jgi:hypothetical protein
MDDLSLDQLSGLPLVSPIWQQEKALAFTARASFFVIPDFVSSRNFAVSENIRDPGQQTRQSL